VVDNLTALCYNYYISKETNKQLRKRNKMKNIVSILAVVAATATSVSAATTTEDVNWVGTAVDLPDACVFTKNVDGEMTYVENSDDQGGVWTVTKRAELGVNRRGNAVLKIEADNKIVRSDASAGQGDATSAVHTMYDVTVDYAAGDNPSELLSSVYTPTQTGPWNSQAFAAGSSAEFQSGFWGKHNNVMLGGTATMKNANALIDNGEYTLAHTATCMQ
jgi:hypothetical protein